MLAGLTFVYIWLLFCKNRAGYDDVHNALMQDLSKCLSFVIRAAVRD